MDTIYQKAIKSMPENEIAHWCSDLYLKKTETSSRLVSEYEFSNMVTTFIAIDSTLWYDIPFAYDPFWIDHEV